MSEPAQKDRREEKRRARSAARLAAVQALFQMEQTGARWQVIAGEFESHRFGTELEGEQLAEADGKLFRTLLESAVEHQREIDRAVDAHLSANWQLKRIDPTLRAVFRAGGAELLVHPNTSHRIIIDEFVEIAKAFFSGDTPRFANAVLDRLAKTLRKPADEPTG